MTDVCAFLRSRQFYRGLRENNGIIKLQITLSAPLPRGCVKVRILSLWQIGTCVEYCFWLKHASMVWTKQFVVVFAVIKTKKHVFVVSWVVRCGTF